MTSIERSNLTCVHCSITKGSCIFWACCQKCLAWHMTARGSTARSNLLPVKHLLPPAPF